MHGGYASCHLNNVLNNNSISFSAFFSVYAKPKLFSFKLIFSLVLKHTWNSCGIILN